MHDRDGRRDLGDRGRLHPRADQDDPVGAVLEQRLDHRPLAPRAAAAGADHDLVADRRGELLDAGRDLGEERVVEVVEQHPHRARPAAGEAAGQWFGR